MTIERGGANTQRWHRRIGVWPFGRESVLGKHARNHAFSILAVTCLAMLTLTASVIARTVSEAQNRVFFRNLAETALQRSEQIVDDVSVSLAALARRASIACDDSTLVLFQTEAQHLGAVHDFRIVDNHGQTLCSTNPVTPASDRQRLDLAAGLHSHDGQVRLVALAQDKSPALGIFRALDAGRGIVAVVRTDTLAENLAPVSLRGGDETRVRLNDGAVIASYAEQHQPAMRETAIERRPIAFRAASRRYPLQAEISVDGTLLTNWSSQVRSAYAVRAGL
ncbi:MAG: hypothetical protein NXI27_13520 [Alphaproteobacteria bacterium]|nr:hypothetical protein [Alphaproteobacteria bacterium]